MAKAIERINRDIAAIETAISGLAEEFHNSYNRYLAALGQAMRQQLILASYHLCTQAYPDAFLSLSFSQRQKLQEAIKQLGDRAKQELASQLYPPAPNASNNLPGNDSGLYFDPLPEEVMEVGDLEQISDEEFPSSTAKPSVANLGLPPTDNTSKPSIANLGLPPTDNTSKPSIANLGLPPTGNTSKPSIANLGLPPLATSQESIASDNQSSEENSAQVTNPEDLVFWQEKLESAIAKTLQRVSRDSNRLLQQTGILPKKLPEPILEAAAKVDASAETIPGPPNLLNLVIETENDRDAQSSTITHLTAIHLRLSEIEFADSSLTALRHQIRNLSVKLTTSRREYQKKQREKAIAEAESAWRTSWFDE